MNYYNMIKNKLLDNGIYSKVKDYTKNKVITFFEIGKFLHEVDGIYSDDITGQFSKKMLIDVGKSYNPRTLRRIRQYYLTFRKEKWSLLATKLTWSIQ